MGADITAHTIIGTKITFETLRGLSESTRIPGCNCGIASRDEKFCSECGKPAWIVKRDLDEEEILEALSDEFRINYIADYDQEIAYIGYVSKRVHHEGRTESCMIINTSTQAAELVTEAYDKIQALCDQNRLGCMANMGIWTVMEINV